MQSKIGVISGSRILTMKIKEEVKKQNLNIIVRQASSVNALNEAEKLLSKGVKVLISRGNTTAFLRRNLDVPIVDIKHTFFDCYEAYVRASKFSQKIAFLATSSAFELMLKKSKDHLKGVTIIPINLFEDKEIIDSKINEMIEMGIEVAIGGLSLENKISALGIRYVMSGADNDAICEAINEALHLLKIETEREESRLELKNKYETINSIFNCASEGIISIDHNGIITNANTYAKRILSQNPEGKHISKVIPSEHFINILKTGNSISNEIINYGKNSLIANIEPVKVSQNTIGTVVTLQQSKQIQAVEQKIRHIMLNKGHISDKTFDDIIGESDKLRSTKEIAKRYAKVDSTVLILGETGTGKELFAQSIHNFSQRREAPFVAINCAAFPSSILESELFGYVKGAFTGALSEGKVGMFELAHQGTIFLDEISETPLEVQLKLLRVIQEKKIMRIGDDKVIPIDVRIIAASNKDLKKQIKKGLFREDFYYRICVLELKIPSLRERREDIPALIHHYIENSRIPVKGITNEAIDILASANWPGNVRQLNNIMERLIVSCNNDFITSDVVKKVTDISGKESEKNEDIKPNLSLDNVKNDFNILDFNISEAELIKKVLVQTKGNRKIAAEKLGISTTTLWRKIKKIKSIDENFLSIVKYVN